MNPLSPDALRTQGLTVYYGQTPAILDITLNVPQGKMTAIIGPNGAGKSTLLKAVAGALVPDHGELWVGGAQGKKALPLLTYVPQRGEIDWDFPVTVFDVVKQGLYGTLGLLGRFRDTHKHRVHQALEMVGILELASRQIGQLSGGQQQRVFLARALAKGGEVFLLDEPFAGVDAKTEGAIVEVLKALQAQDKSVFVVHHDLTTVTAYFDHVILLNQRLVGQGPLGEVFTPTHLRAAYGGNLALFPDDPAPTPGATP